MKKLKLNKNFFILLAILLVFISILFFEVWKKQNKIIVEKFTAPESNLKQNLESLAKLLDNKEFEK
ncbi:MAG: hypothetical protein LBF33_00315 [Oscillospiraceae bacterium]|nr:hypothetical protein [Oscillospiraceae bacterium]